MLLNGYMTYLFPKQIYRIIQLLHQSRDPGIPGLNAIPIPKFRDWKKALGLGPLFVTNISFNRSSSSVISLGNLLNTSILLLDIRRRRYQAENH